MGKKVPDISPEGLQALTRQYQKSVDRAVVNLLLNESVATLNLSAIEAWRESAGLSKAGTARLMGMSKHGYLAVENGTVPLTEHFLTRLRSLLKQLDSTGFEFHPSDRSRKALPYKEFYEKHVPRKLITGDGGEWRTCANPECPHPWNFFTNRSRKYCSQECSDYVARHKKIDGIVTKTLLPQKTGLRPIIVRCPNCKHEFATRGNVINGSTKYPGGYKYKSNGQADHDQQEQVHQEVGGVLSDGLLPNDKSSVQSSE